MCTCKDEEMEEHGDVDQQVSWFNHVPIAWWKTIDMIQMINHQMYTENISSDSPSAPVGKSHSSSPFQAKVLDAAHALNDAVEDQWVLQGRDRSSWIWPGRGRWGVLDAYHHHPIFYLHIL